MKKICICGSTKFRKEIKRLAWSLTKSENMVLFAPFSKEETSDLEKYRDILHKIHCEKIKVCNLILIFNKDGYIGSDTHKEIMYAFQLEKRIKFWSDTNIGKYINLEGWKWA